MQHHYKVKTVFSGLTPARVTIYTWDDKLLPSFYWRPKEITKDLTDHINMVDLPKLLHFQIPLIKLWKKHKENIIYVAYKWYVMKLL